MATNSHPPAPFAGVNATWVYTLGSMVFFLVMLDLLVITDVLGGLAETQSPALFALAVVCVLASALRIRYCWFLRDGSGSGQPPVAWTVAMFAPAVVAWGIAFVAPQVPAFAAAQLWLSAVMFSLVLRRSVRWPVLVVSLAVALIPVIAQASRGVTLAEQFGRPVGMMVAVYGLLLPFALLSSLWFWRIVRRLDEARSLAGELAVTRERLRFAADLHDIQGHHLQVIALKAELVERTLATKPEYAAEQAGAIRLIAKEAMEETRSLVAGLRDVRLSDELENAREVLSLAGAACTLEVAATPEAGGPERVLAFAVREATTNILRHSDASRARISLAPVGGGFELVVSNNGIGETDGLGNASEVAEGTHGGGGSGLAGLRERVAAIGGSLTAAVTRARAAPVGAADTPGARQPGGSGLEGPQFELRVWVPQEGAA
ncbi:sensor histidine kinase [Leucobacter albus]|uniref:Sensor histidine kinase n=1 Tax=Leucobacter albus TaxID=272210 RepID=A0ABW3TRW9_9MICO